MSENISLMSTGAFAKHCKTTKETLFHYYESGLLSPVFIGDNNYRYYSPEQVNDFNKIKLLSSFGCTLKEIKKVLESDDQEQYKKLLIQKKKYIEEKIIEMKNTLEIIEREIKM